MKTLRNPLTRTPAGLLSAAALLLPGLLQAQPSAHYVPGVEGLKAATLPPPGVYLRDYNVAYWSDRLNDSSGNRVPGLDPQTFIYGNVPRVIWITDAQVLGGFIGVDALLPLQYTDLDFTAGPNTIIDDSKFGIGDFFAEVTWSKHIQQFDFSLAAGFWAPTGQSSPTAPSTDPGNGYWTTMFTAGATWYLDHGKQWAISALNRYEINTQKQGTDVTPGQAYTLEWGVSRSVAKIFDVGAVGYYQQQVTGDTGSASGTPHNRVAAVGPEIAAFFPKATLGISLRYLYEFMAENRLQGQTITLTVTKRF